MSKILSNLSSRYNKPTKSKKVQKHEKARFLKRDLDFGDQFNSVPPQTVTCRDNQKFDIQELNEREAPVNSSSNCVN